MDSSHATWRKASRSTSNGGECIEVASIPGVVALRDSKNPDGPKVVVKRNHFRHLINALKKL
ncbi:uncharacterized protein DUF397 [Actinomadura pelletieri DSM 43383]|uniref:Uncharacterized protein DUF397 n=1 Tax=Actinomadura pelletieri DSM 43383 TaxID=1120940 RepID=A0A495QY25_9ACTN|nr:DUF397 domain-containing protein [Actinomadura pelletieri]RKS79033.1 uncharacterized protein DUF397 [Actinomadura pelletieri DSM 43383]